MVSDFHSNTNIENNSKPLVNKQKTNKALSSNARKVGMTKPHRPSPILMNSVLSKYISKSIVVAVSLCILRF